MSGTGSTIPDGGIPGEAGQDAMPMSQTVADNPSQIAQTTSNLTLNNLLQRDYIFHSAPTISTSMPPGTIIAAIPNHPEQVNYVSRHIAPLFNAWTGDLLLRFRLIATAWYGGSIRAAILPPNFTRAQINAMSLEVLTAYPNVDFDPKNTTWQHITSTDQRDVAFHYMEEFNDTNARGFGGWIVFFVAAKLVTQAPEFQTIQMFIETTSRHIYDQPRPLLNFSDTQHPLKRAVTIPLLMQPLAESYMAGSEMQLCVLPATTGTVNNTVIGHKGVGRSSLIGVPGISIFNTATFENLSARSKSCYGYFLGDSDAANVKPISTSDPFPISIDSRNTILNCVPHGPTGANIPYFDGAMSVNNFNRDAIQWQTITITDPGDEIKGYSRHTRIMLDPEPKTGPPQMFFGESSLVGSITNLAVTESIVLFNMPSPGFIHSQTALISQDCESFGVDIALTDRSFIYELRNPSNDPVLLLRLCPNGLFTTNPASAAVLYPIGDGFSLSFLEERSMNSPLPPLTTYARSLRHGLRQITAAQTPRNYYKMRAAAADMLSAY